MRKDKLTVLKDMFETQMSNWKLESLQVTKEELVTVAEKFSVIWLSGSKEGSTSYLFTLKGEGKTLNMIMNCGVFNKLNTYKVSLIVKSAVIQYLNSLQRTDK
jgi:hypothetical protein